MIVCPTSETMLQQMYGFFRRWTKRSPRGLRTHLALLPILGCFHTNSKRMRGGAYKVPKKAPHRALLKVSFNLLIIISPLHPPALQAQSSLVPAGRSSIRTRSPLGLLHLSAQASTSQLHCDLNASQQNTGIALTNTSCLA